MAILRLDHLVDGWKDLYRYIECLTEARAGVVSDGKFDRPFGPVRKSVLAGRFYLRNRIQKLDNVRKITKARAAASSEGRSDEPLVSVVLPTRDRCGLLMERAIPSVLSQTYPNIEVIVVGDRCTDDTERMVRGLELDRVKFFRLPESAWRPHEGYDAWLVAGVDASNMGIRMSSGDWIVHLDDDDELMPEHVDVLLRFAIENDLEMAYGRVLAVMEDGERIELGSFPPELGKMTHSGVLLSSRLRFFSYDRNTWKYLEPGDWSLWRRMKEVGVRMGFLDRVLGVIYPAGPGAYHCGPSRMSRANRKDEAALSKKYLTRD